MFRVVLARSQDGGVLATAQSGSPPTIRIWDFKTTECLTVLSAPTVDIGTLTFSVDGSLLATFGRDVRARVVITVWDVSRIREGLHPVFARQVSDFPITRLKFSPYQVSRWAWGCWPCVAQILHFILAWFSCCVLHLSAEMVRCRGVECSVVQWGRRESAHCRCWSWQRLADQFERWWRAMSCHFSVVMLC